MVGSVWLPSREVECAWETLVLAQMTKYLAWNRVVGPGANHSSMCCCVVSFSAVSVVARWSRNVVVTDISCLPIGLRTRSRSRAVAVFVADGATVRTR